MTDAPRPPRRYPTEDECAAILVASDRTCCVCREGGKAIQLHHLDDDRSNPDPDNFAVLCLECHNQTLVQGGFGRRLNEAQIRRYRDEWTGALRDRVAAEARESAHGEPIIGAPPTRADDVVDSALAAAETRSPRVGLALLGGELDQVARRILASTGWGRGRHDWNLRDAIDELHNLGVVSRSVHMSLAVLEDTRAAIAAGNPVPPKDVLRALDVAVSTFRALAAIPVERNYVAEASIAMHETGDGGPAIPGVFGVRIRTIGPPPRQPREAVFLTRREDYVPGTEVTWLWGSDVLGPLWYLDTSTGRYVEQKTVEFTGLALDDIA